MIHLYQNTTQVQKLIETDEATYIIDGKKCSDEAAFHAHIKDVFKLPDYYGNNLDALFDCLCDDAILTAEIINIVIENVDDFYNDEESDLYADLLFLLSDASMYFEDEREQLFEVFPPNTEWTVTLLEAEEIEYQVLV